MKERQERGIYDNASSANKGGYTSVCYLVLLLQKGVGVPFSLWIWLQCHPCPTTSFQQGLLQAALHATELRKKQREGSVRASRGVCAWTKPPQSERCPAPLRRDAAVEEAEPLRGAAGPAAHLCLSTSPTEDGAKDRIPGNNKGHPEERLVSLSAWQLFSQLQLHALV